LAFRTVIRKADNRLSGWQTNKQIDREIHIEIRDTHTDIKQIESSRHADIIETTRDIQYKGAAMDRLISRQRETHRERESE